MFRNEKAWSELSAAVSAEQLKQSGMINVKSMVPQDEAFARLLPYLIQKRTSVPASIVRKLA
jgi:hypothetical protein